MIDKVQRAPDLLLDIKESFDKTPRQAAPPLALSFRHKGL